MTHDATADATTADPPEESRGQPPVVSVLLPTKNGGDLLKEALERVFSQETPFAFEVVAVDSGSTDDTLETLSNHPVRLYQIPPSEFNHGATRNLLARLARGDVLVFLSQDALPRSDSWLRRLVEPVLSGEAAGAYARQVPRRDTNPVNAFFLRHVYPPESRTQRLGPEGADLTTIHFSNVASAIRRDVLELEPFKEDIIMSEDQEWSARVLRRGFALRYVAEARVEHAHEYTLPQLFRRYFDTGVSYRDVYGAAPPRRRFSLEFLLSGVHHVRSKLGHLRRSGNARWIPRALLVSAVKLLAVLAGRHHTLLPRPLKARLSQHRSYWLVDGDGAHPGSAPSSAAPAEEGG